MPQILDIPIDGGLDQNADARLRDRVAIAEDVLYTRRGGLQPRLGQELLPVEALQTRPSVGGRDRALVARGNQMAVVSESIVRPYAPSSSSPIVPTSDGQLGSVGWASAYTVERRNEDGSSQTHRDMNHAEGAGFRCYVWLVRDDASGNSTAYYRLVDSETGGTLTRAVAIDLAPGVYAAVHVVYKNDLFFVCIAAAAGVYVTSLDPIFFIQTTVQVNAFNSLALAAIPHPTTNHILVASSAGAFLELTVVSALGTPAAVGLTSFTVAAGQVTSVALYCADPVACWVAWGEGGVGTPPNGVTVNTGIVNVTTPASPAVTGATVAFYTETGLDNPAAANSCFVYAVSIDAGDPDDVDNNATWVAFTVTGRDSTSPAAPYTTYRPMTGLYRLNTSRAAVETIYAFGAVLASDLWRTTENHLFCMVEQTARYMVPAGVGIVPPLGCMHIVANEPLGDNLTPTAIDGFPCQVHATFGVLVTPLSDTFLAIATESTQKRQPSCLSKVLSRDDGSREALCYALERADTSPHVYTAIARPVLARTHAQMGGRTFISGGLPTLWDGSVAVEWGFAHGPKVFSSAIANFANSIGAGSYSWAAGYEWIDANGGVMHSPVTVLLAAQTLTANQRATFVVNPAQLTHKPDKWGYAGVDSRSYVVLYRTEANSTGPFYRLTAIEVPSTNLNAVGQIESAVSIIDAYPDTGGARGPLATFPPLYITGDVLEADPVPGCSMVTTWQQRFVLAGTDDDSVWFSTENEDGEVPYFSIGLRLAPFENGRITGIAVLDEKLVLFKETGIYTLSGQLPNKQGIGFIPTPVQVSTDAGCIDPQSVVAFPQGVMFRSARGIYVLDRSLQVSFLGEPVARTVEASAKTVAPMLVTKQNHIRFDLHDEAEGGAGSVAVYDYLRGMWTQSRYAREDDTSQAPAAQLVAADGRVYWLDADGALWRDRENAYADNDDEAVFTYRVRSGWIKAAGPQGYFTSNKAGILGKYGLPHTLTVNVYADYDESTVIASNTYELSSAPSAGYQFMASIATARTARMQAIAIEAIVSALDGETAIGPEPPAELSSFILEWDPIDNAAQRRIPAAQKR
jgi:hypothetical protein